MRMYTPFWVGAAVVGLVSAFATPVYAGSTWGAPQVVSASAGRSIQLSDYGGVAVWIAAASAQGTGPVRTSRYRPTGSWSMPKTIPGAAGVSSVQLSADGNTALMQVEGTGYLWAQRTGTVWGAAQTLIPGAQVAGGQMSRDARAVAWVDWAGSQTTPLIIPGTLKSMVRRDDGTWSAPVTVGTVLPGAASQSRAPLALSRNGSTVVWLDETSELQSARLLSGVWQPSVAIAQINPTTVGLTHLAVERDGNDVVWMVSGGASINFSEYVSGWQPAQQLSTAASTVISTAPNTRTIAFVDTAGYFNLLVRTSTGWATTAKRLLGGAARVTSVNSAAAFTHKRPGRSVLRSYVLSRGQWLGPVKLSSKAKRPAFAADGNTLAWVSGGRILAVKR